MPPAGKMIVMEGLMLCPPERGTIIGRASWKPRYCVLGTGSQHNPDGSGPRSRKGSKVPSKTSQIDLSQPDSPHRTKLYITIFKAKGDWEYLQQHAVSAFKTCEIQSIQHRKQSPSLPTLMLELKPDTVADKQRKRRSSRSGGLSKDQHSNILLFRTMPDERHTIYDWQRNVKPLLTPDDSEDRPLSPFSPIFHNPFANVFTHRDVRSSSSQKPELQQRISYQHSNSYASTHREKPSDLISPSPSLRSRRSDLSSQASSQPPMGFTSSHPTHYNTLPADLPSPASTSGYDGQFIEGWTSAQGRSSALSSHTRGSNSIVSTMVSPMAAPTSPAPRETILDRAFQMRCIPGSDRVTEEKISSIARFEALMREVDERKEAKAHAQAPPVEGLNWDLEEESEESSDEEPDEDDLRLSDEEIAISTPAQRALDYIAGRRPPLPTNRPLSPAPTLGRHPTAPFLNSQAMSAFHGNGNLRPRTGTTSSRKGENRPNSVALPSRSLSTNAVPILKPESHSNTTQNLKASDAKEKRRSSTSVKRLSFTDFAKRLSSTSSLLLVQTNASSSSGLGDSRRVSFEEEDQGGLGMMGMRGAGVGDAGNSNRDKRCGWRGSVGVFGGEGGFL